MKDITAECQRLLNMKYVSQQTSKLCTICSIKSGENTPNASEKRPITVCRSCGQKNYSRFHPFKKHPCPKWNRLGLNKTFCYSHKVKAFNTLLNGLISISAQKNFRKTSCGTHTNRHISSKLSILKVGFESRSFG